MTPDGVNATVCVIYSSKSDAMEGKKLSMMFLDGGVVYLFSFCESSLASGGWGDERQ